MYCIAGKFGGELNLVVWQSTSTTARLKFLTRIYTYGDPVPTAKLNFLQWPFGTQPPNLIPTNISGYTVCSRMMYCSKIAKKCLPKFPTLRQHPNPLLLNIWCQTNHVQALPNIQHLNQHNLSFLGFRQPDKSRITSYYCKSYKRRGL